MNTSKIPLNHPIKRSNQDSHVSVIPFNSMKRLLTTRSEELQKSNLTKHRTILTARFLDNGQGRVA